MAVSTLQEGLRDLTRGFETRYKVKADREKARKEELAAQKKQEALTALGGVVSGSVAGDTDLGKYISTGLTTGQLDAKDAMGTFSGLEREKLIMGLHSKALRETDPAKKRELQNAAAYMSDKLFHYNEDEAYWKTRGALVAKMQLGFRFKNGDGFQASSSGKIPVQVSIDPFKNDLLEFIKNDKVYNLVPDDKLGNGVLNLDIPLEEKQAFRDRIDTFLKNKFKDFYGTLPARHKEGIIANMGQVIQKYGDSAIVGLGTSGSDIMIKGLTEPADIDPDEWIQMKQDVESQGSGKKKKFFMKPGKPPEKKTPYSILTNALKKAIVPINDEKKLTDYYLGK